jgi:hypothetical protein
MIVTRPLASGTTYPAITTALTLVGHAVYISDTLIGGMAQVEKADITDINKMPVVGIVIYKADATHCTVQRTGRVNLSPRVDLVPSKRYFVGYDSKPTDVSPGSEISPTGECFIQPLGVATSNSTIELLIAGTLTKVRT